MAHKKGVGSTDNGRDSNSKRLGVKLFGGQYAKAGNIIVRQRGTKYHAGSNVYMGKDHTLHAKIEGHVDFSRRRLGRTFVSILPLDSALGAATNGSNKKSTSKSAEAKASKPANTATQPASFAGASAVGAAAVTTTTTDKASSGKPDDLRKIEGIGPKIAEHLGAAGIISFSDLADASTDKLQEILTNAGPRYKMHNPSTWPQQAALARDGKWDELKVLQDELDGGVVKSGEEE